MNETEMRPQPSAWPRRRLIAVVLSGLFTLAGVVVMAGYGWMLVQQPDLAGQITALIVILAAIGLILLDPVAGFLVWLFLTPFANYLPLNLNMPAGVPDLGFTRVVGGFLALFLLAEIARGRRRLAPLTLVEAALPLFALALAMSAWRSINGWLWGLQAVFDSFLVALIAYLIARHLILTPRQFRLLAATLMAVGAIVAALTVSEQLTGWTLFRAESTAEFYAPGIRKVAAVLGHPAYIAVTLALLLALAVEQLQAGRGRRRGLLLAGLSLLYLAAIYLTYNRSGWLAALLVLMVSALVFPRFRRLGLPLLAAGAIVLALAWGSGRLNLEDSAAGERLTAESPVDYRLEALETGLQLVEPNPALGVGWGSFGRLAARAGFRPGANVHVLPSTHNSYLNFLVSGGVLLLGAYLVLMTALGLALLRLTRRLRRQRRPIPASLLAAWIVLPAYLLPTVAFDNNYSIYANIVFWSVMGGALAVGFDE
jgi:O-antigen ligase